MSWSSRRKSPRKIEHNRRKVYALSGRGQRDIFAIDRKVLGVGATARASLYLYNDTDDVDALAEALVAAADFFAF